MKKYLLQENGKFYKANLHCHSTYSDGKLTPAELKELYKSLGYSIVAYTDHDIMVPHDDLNDDSFLALHGFEVEVNERSGKPWPETKCLHMCCIGIDPENIVQPLWHRESYLFGNAPLHRNEVTFDENEPDYVRSYGSEGGSEMMQIARDKGFFVTYNHPTWSLETYPDYMGYNGMHAFEMYNGGCLAVGYLDYHPRIYDDMLMGGKKLYCIGADDNHNCADPKSRKYDSGWAWTMIKADSLDYRDITKSLVDGQFYASEGPEIRELYYEDGNVYVKCSGADRIVCNYDIRCAHSVFANNDIPVTEACFKINKKAKYFRITVIDMRGRRACSNAYFVDTLTD